MRGKRLLSLVLSVCMLLMCMPFSIYAANDEAVIDKVTYKGTAYSPKDKSIVLSVPYSFTGSIDLESVLSISYVKQNYTYFAPSYPGGSSIKYGETKTLRTRYTTESGGDIQQSDYTVTLEKSAEVKPSFSGTISKRLSMDGEDLKFTRKEFEDLYKQNDGKAFGGIIIDGANTAIAGFRVNSSTLNTASGGKVTAANLDKLYIVPKGVGKANFLVRPIDSSGNAMEGYITLEVEVIKTTVVSVINAELDSQLDNLSLRSINLSSNFSKTAGSDPVSVKITGLPSQGKLVYNYSSDGNYGSTAVSNTYMELADFNKLSYIPNRDSITRTLTDTIDYTAKDKAGNEYKGSISISIPYQRMGLADLTGNAKAGEAVKLSALADIAKAYEAAGDGSLGYVFFTLPDSSAASLRYGISNSNKNGEAVSETTGYYITGSSRKYLKDVYFVPAADYSGTVYIYYEAYNSKGASPLFGRIKVSVSNYSLTNLSYSVYQDEYLPFIDIVDDINGKFRAADVSSGNFSYVRFALPGSSYGTLYYSYKSDLNKGNKVTASENYYRSGSGKQLADVSFVPNKSWAGDFTLKYNAFDADGNSFSGEIDIKVKESRYDVSTLVLTTKGGKAIKLNASDLNKSFSDSTGVDFEYLYFSDLPLARSGNLYYKYGTTGAEELVEESDEDIYYRTGTDRALSDVSYVPAKDYTGDAEIEYRAYVSRSEYYDGKIIVRVTDRNVDLPEIEYECASNRSAAFAGPDFSTALKKLTSDALDYVIFEIPDASQGKLYYNYESASKYDYEVEEGDIFNRLGSKNIITNVSFVPKMGYTGEFEIPYTAYTDEEEEYYGVVKMTITKAEDFEDVPKTAYFYDPVRWAVEEGITDGTSLTRFSPDRDCTRAHVITFLWRAKGCPEPKSPVSPYPDVKETDYFFKPATWAFEEGIYTGTTTGTKGLFAPDKVVTRRDFVYLLWRAEGQPSKGNQENRFTDVPNNDSALTAILWAYKNGITDGTNAEATTFSPDKTTNRAQVVTFLYRAYE